MLIVACVLSPGPVYSEAHVHRLKAQVSLHLNQDYQFVCVDNSPYPGYWAKISLFQPKRFTGRVLYLDLDVTVIGNLDDLVRFEAPFAAIKDYQYPMTINSSVMTWDAGIADHVYTEFTPSVMEKYRGDQNWINNRVPTAKRFPPEYCQSFKLAMLNGGFHPDLRVCVFHGFPKPWELIDYA